MCCRFCFPSPENGNLFEQPPGELLNTPRLKGMRAGILAPGPVVPKDCENCLYLSGEKAAKKVLASPLPTLIRRRLASGRA